MGGLENFKVQVQYPTLHARGLAGKHASMLCERLRRAFGSTQRLPLKSMVYLSYFQGITAGDASPFAFQLYKPGSKQHTWSNRYDMSGTLGSRNSVYTSGNPPCSTCSSFVVSVTACGTCWTSGFGHIGLPWQQGLTG